MVTLPGAVLSLGVGEIQVKTALNQALHAEIPLYSVKAREVETLTVRLASVKEFSDAGIDRPWVLSKLRFAIKQKADGIPYIEISTKDSIREPFLNFLLDIEWASGRLLREYTILLDPPVMMSRKPAMVSKPKVSEPVVTPAAPTVTPEPEEKLGPPTIDEGEEVKVKAAPPIMAPVAKPAVVAAEPAAPAKPAAPAAEPAAMPEPVAESAPEDDLFPRIDIGEGAAPTVAPAPMAGADSFGPAKDSDTLWSIAKAARPDDAVSIEQAMMAILKANPDAFAEGNINGLRTGAVLRIPDRDAMVAMDHQAAIEETRLQHQMWSRVRPQSPAAETIQRKDVAKGPAAADDTGKPVEPEVKLVTPSKTTKAGSGAGLAKDMERLQDELALARENLASKDQENTELQTRIRDLEEQIQNMQRLMTLKDDDLARLQEKLAAEQQAAPAPVPEVATKEPEPAEPVAKAEVQTAPAVTPAPAAAPTDSEVNPFALKEKPAPTPAPQPAPAAEAPKPAPVPAQPKPAPVQDQFAKPSGGIVDDILGNPMILGVVVVGIIVLIGIVWVAIRRRRMGSMEFPESILHGKTATEVPEPSETASLLTDFSSTAIGESEVGEVDPLAEADVFIAYKRFGQAEEMLKQSLSAEPDRDDLKLKLMEVYKETGNREAFDTLAQELHDSLDSQSGALWEKAVAMGQAFAPDNPLFGGGVEPEMEAMVEEAMSGMEDLGDTALTKAEAEEAEALSADMGLDFETEAEVGEELAEEPMETAAAGEAEPMEEEIGLDLSSLEAAEEESKAATSEVDDALAGLDLDLSSLEDMTTEEEPAETAEEESLEFDTSALDAGLEETAKTPAAEEDTSLDLDLDLSALEETMEPAAEETFTPAEEDTGLEFDMGGMETAVEEEPAAEVDTSTTDEVATKLDLARAYIDMGDPEGARSILEEVSTEGNDAQKKEAQELMGQL
jgi:pilus assembly protein FimV